MLVCLLIYFLDSLRIKTLMINLDVNPHQVNKCIGRE